MRDGVILRADLTLPAGCDRAPVILIRQPYGRATPAMMLDQTASFWARKGYACVVQDVRGKFSSDGVFEPVVNEINDGFDTVDWITRQTWCSGKVGMWGGVLLRPDRARRRDVGCRGPCLHRTRRHRHGLAQDLVPPGRHVPEHDGALGDRDGCRGICGLEQA